MKVHAKALRRSASKQTGFAAVEALLILVIVAIVSGTGYFVWHAKQNTDSSLKNAANSQLSSSHTVKSGSVNTSRSALKYSSTPTFYDCFFSTANSSNENGSCTLNGVKYTVPKTYSDDMIRSFPDGHYTNLMLTTQLTKLRSIAQEDFKTCDIDLPHITVFHTTDDFMYVTIGCDSGHREVWHREGNIWSRIYTGQFEIDCATVDKYKVPASLMSVSGEPNMCYDYAKQAERNL